MSYLQRFGKWLWVEVLFTITAALYVWAFIASPDKALSGLQYALNSFIGVLPTLVAVFLVIGLFNVFIDKKKVAALLGPGAGLKGLLLAGLIGSILVGPVYAVFPLIQTVREHGARWAVIGAVLTSWAVKIPMIPMEVAMLGWKFSVTRTVLVLAFSLPVGFALEWLMGRGSDSEPEPKPEPLKPTTP